MTVYPTWLRDTHHNLKEQQLIGIYSSKQKAIAGIKKLEIEEPLSKGDLRTLELCNQTQGRKDNYHIDKVELDKPLIFP